MTTQTMNGLEPCVHCGFCLQSCPTYLATGDEADSPRGRIVLMQGLARGNLNATDPPLVYHLDRCLGCLACEPACPSGVSYRVALESARSIIARSRPVPLIARAVNVVMADRRLLKPLMGSARLLRPLAGILAGESRLGFAFGMLRATRNRRSMHGPRPAQPKKSDSSPPVPPSADHSTPCAALFTGCIMDGLFAHVHLATQRTLQANGYSLARVQRQVCCGALHAHTGEHDKALQLARGNVAAFAAHPDCLIAVDSAGCGAMLKDYGRLLRNDPLSAEANALSERVRDVSELLVPQGPRVGQAVGLRVAYDPPCHLLHAQGISTAPLELLRSIPGIKMVHHADAATCCGSAGSYSLTELQLSRTVLSQKITALVAAEPDLVATGNPGCIMQIGAGLTAAGHDIPVIHPIEILDWSYDLAGFYDS
ncbi:MAG: 4Fe-4S dicluster domain-containing protein [Gemmatimonadota bacterium]|nr:MAG: 4Fe-4S dicluster domain-containing protein [Gemmatimonadota bacterium]